MERERERVVKFADRFLMRFGNDGDGWRFVCGDGGVESDYVRQWVLASGGSGVDRVRRLCVF